MKTPLRGFMPSHFDSAALMTVILVAAGCHPAPTPLQMEAARQRALSLLMPSRIEIVQPFTRVKSFDDDQTPDGIELLLRAVNALDNPGLMIVGDVRFELYEFVPASARPTGRRIDQWTAGLNTVEDQRRYWNQLTQMYEFPLAIDPETIPLLDSYVLVVTYNSPLGEHLTDEYVIQGRELGLTAHDRLGGRP